MKQVIPEIYIKDARIALDFYKDIFGGEIKNLQMSDNMEMFQEMKGKVIHSELHINSRCVFYFVDILNTQRAKTGNVTLVLHLDNKKECDRIYSALKKDGAVLMELQQTFWGAYHAIVTDQFGAPWALNLAE